MVSIIPHTFSAHFNPDLVGEMLEIPPTAVNKVVEKLCNLLVKLPAKSKTTFSTALRSVLTVPRYFRDFPEKCLSIDILVISVSEAIAENHDSLIDLAKLLRNYLNKWHEEWLRSMHF